MNRFYVPFTRHEKQILIRDPAQLHHISHVLRLKPGDRVEVFNGAGTDCVCSLTRLSRDEATLAVEESKITPPPKTRLAVACALPKKDIMDDIVDKLTQLGVDEIIPLMTDRVVARPAVEGAEARAARWQRIALSATQQSHRASLPIISSLTDFKSVLARTEFDLRLIPTLTEKTVPLRQAVDVKKPPAAVLILIGPEGDFTDEERAAAVGEGFIPVSLGQNVLRVSAAAIAAAAYFRLALE